MVKRRKDIVGQKFNRLVVIEFSRTIRETSFYLCQCDCGTKKEIRYSNLLNGVTQSCGCLRNERVSAAKKKHGKTGTVEYKTWSSMIERCTNPNHSRYADYGGRGIVVCSQWLGPQGFINFFSDMGPRPGSEYSIDRINNSGNYEPNNCRWATRKEQNNNYRQNRYVEINGVTKNITEWAKVYDISRDVIYCRIQKKWDLTRAITTPVRRHKSLR